MEPTYRHRGRDYLIAAIALPTGLVASAAAILGLIAPNTWTFGPFELSLRHFGWPLALAAAMLLVFSAKFPRPFGPILGWQRFLLAVDDVWKRGGLRERALIALLCTHGVLSVAIIGEMCERQVRTWQASGRLPTTASVRTNPEEEAYREFVRRCRTELPENTRLLYNGGWEAFTFSYEVFPRKVFLTPQTWRRLSCSWHRTRWLEKKCRGKLDETLEPYWTNRLPTLEIEPVRFAHDRRLNAYASFDFQAPANAVIRYPFALP
ncbi:hypothetical protein JCM19992_26120 [Thermostilla marina]